MRPSLISVRCDIDQVSVLGRRRKLVEHSWAGRAPSGVLPSPRSPDPPVPNIFQNNHRYRVHRIKVAEKAGIILTTSQVGGLLVRDLESDEVLWELPVVRNLTFSPPAGS